MTLTEFLLARIAEDEADARGDTLGAVIPQDCWGPDRVLAECEAKRRIVDACQNVEQVHAAEFLADRMLAFLALPYADHPDYREEWRP